MRLQYLAGAFALIFQITVFAQFGRPGTYSNQITLEEVESINAGMRAKAAEELKKQREIAQRAELQVRNRQKAEREYLFNREAAQAALLDLPETPDRLRQLDRFNCLYPSSATLPPTSQDVDSCILQIFQIREEVKLKAVNELAAKAKFERIAEENRKARETLKAEQKRHDEEKMSAEAAAAAEARDVALAADRARLVSQAIGAIGFAGVAALGFQRRKHGWQMLIAAMTMGFLSGLQIYFIAAMLVTGKTVPHSGGFVAVTLFGGWILSTHLLLKGAVSASKVLARGFLLGATEWLAMIPVGFIATGSMVSDIFVKSGGSAASQAGAVIGGGLLVFLTGGLSVAMAIVCMIGYAMTYFITREMKPEFSETAKKTCPECAESIQADAKKCRYCGAVLYVPRNDSAKPVAPSH